MRFKALIWKKAVFATIILHYLIVLHSFKLHRSVENLLHYRSQHEISRFGDLSVQCKDKFTGTTQLSALKLDFIGNFNFARVGAAAFFVSAMLSSISSERAFGKHFTSEGYISLIFNKMSVMDRT